jgi:hypothetical protein
LRNRFLAMMMVAGSALTLDAWAGSEATTNTWYGSTAGASLTTGNQNSLFGAQAGTKVLNGSRNTFIGHSAGHEMFSGSNNTALGSFAAYSAVSGDSNVYLGYGAGYSAAGNYKLYIDTCYYTSQQGAACDRPFIYGEFDNRLLALDGVLDVSNKSTQVAKSQLHFSLGGTDTGGWLTSAGDNNFFMSSGARLDGPAGGWIQRSADGNAVMAGSGATGYRIFTSTGTPVGGAASLLTRFHIDYSGQIGLNTYVVPGLAIATGTGAYLSAGGVWTNASSRDLKENIRQLSAEDAMRTLEGLEPVSFQYKATDGETHVGFIAEDVPELVATRDRKSLSSMDIVAVLTKVVKEQQERLDALTEEVRRLRGAH